MRWLLTAVAWRRPYEEWKEGAEKALVGLALEGLQTVPVVVDPAKFANWLKARKLKSTGATRARYAAFLARKLDAGSGR
jgi:hypothetical protein